MYTNNSFWIGLLVEGWTARRAATNVIRNILISLKNIFCAELRKKYSIKAGFPTQFEC